MSLVVVPTGTANTASVLAALRRLGVSPSMAASAAEVARAERVVLPGVGSFGAAMAEVERQGMRRILVDRVLEGRSTLAVCVGMQLLARASEESADVDGLGLVGQDVRRFPETVRVPQLGWNRVSVTSGECRFVDDGWAYFANSFRITEAPDGWSAAVADHGGTFVAAMERGDVLACQFHPELSGSYGSSVLARWLGSEH
ncbi:MAG TPA: imidazole glycerol phosphate synthase subunit HisH [Acidimicrobiia bacterium]